MTTWLDWVRRLQAVAQNGLHYSENPFDRERYEEVRAIAAEMAALGGEPVEELAARFAAEGGHASPKIDVRAAAFRDGRVLMVRGLDDGLWTLPGGWAEVGESPRAAAEKELREESGYRGRVVKIVGVYEQDLRSRPRLPFHAWKLSFLCELADAEPDSPHASEIDAVEFYAEDALPELSSRVSPQHLQEVFRHLRDPSRATDFD